MTTGERRALTWLLAVTAAGAGVRVLRHWRDRGDATPATVEALSRQLLAVDSAQRGRERSRGRGGGASRGGGRRVRAGTPVADSASAANATSSGGGRRRRRTADRDSALERPTLAIVDLDVADSAALEGLPLIGPALAQRIVADRAARGPYGSLRGLERVRGIGPKLAARLAAHVTFSGNPRPSPVQR